MGLFSFLKIPKAKKKPAKKSVLTSISKYGLIPAVAIGNIFTSVIEKVTKKKYGRTTLKEASSTPFGKTLGLATVGTATALGVAVAGPAAAAKAIIPKSAIGKTAAVFVGGAAVASPTLATTIIETPLSLAKTGKKVGKAIEGLTEEQQTTAGKFGKAGLIVAGAGALIGAGAYGLKKKDKIIDLLPLPTKKDIPLETGGLDQPITPTPPITPETVTMDEPTTKAAEKKPIQAHRQTVKQEVNIIVAEQMLNQKYINAIPY